MTNVLNRLRRSYLRMDDILVARSVLSGSLAIAAAVLAHSHDSTFFDWWMALPLILVAASNIPFFILSMKGHKHLVAWAMVVIDTAFITYLVHYTSGVQSAVSIFYLWPIIASSLLLGTRASYLTAALSAALYLGLAVAEAGGWQPSDLLASRGSRR